MNYINWNDKAEIAKLRNSPYVCHRRSCVYHSGNESGTIQSCNFIFITGISKSSLNAADITKPCPLFKAGTRIIPSVEPMVLSEKSPPNRPKERKRTMKFDPAQFRAMYDEGRNDVEIAKAFGCCADTVLRWRRREGLRANALGGRPKGK